MKPMWKQKLALLFKGKNKIWVALIIFICLSAFLLFLFIYSGIWKVRGASYLLGKDLDSDIYVEVHLWGGKPAIVNTTNPKKPVHTFHVYQATEEQVNALANIPHTYLYSSIFDPCICMVIKLKHLLAVTSLPFVKYVQVIPPATRYA